MKIFFSHISYSNKNTSAACSVKHYICKVYSSLSCGTKYVIKEHKRPITDKAYYSPTR